MESPSYTHPNRRANSIPKSRDKMVRTIYLRRYDEEAYRGLIFYPDRDKDLTISADPQLQRETDIVLSKIIAFKPFQDKLTQGIKCGRVTELAKGGEHCIGMQVSWSAFRSECLPAEVVLEAVFAEYRCGGCCRFWCAGFGLIVCWRIAGGRRNLHQVRVVVWRHVHEGSRNLSWGQGSTSRKRDSRIQRERESMDGNQMGLGGKPYFSPPLTKEKVV